MIKTQVQIPEELYRKAKRIAKEREWSFAEVMRRGLEYMTSTCPELPEGGQRVLLKKLSKGQVRAGADELDLKTLVADEESLRALENVES